MHQTQIEIKSPEYIDKLRSLIPKSLEKMIHSNKLPHIEEIKQILIKIDKNIQVENYLIQCEKRNQRTKHITKQVYNQLTKVVPEIIIIEMIFRNFFYFLDFFKELGPAIINQFNGKKNEKNKEKNEEKNDEKDKENIKEGNIKATWKILEQNIESQYLQKLTQLAFEYYCHWHLISIIKLQIMNFEKQLQRSDDQKGIKMMEEVIILKLFKLLKEIEYIERLKEFNLDFSRTMGLHDYGKSVQKNLTQKGALYNDVLTEFYEKIEKQFPHILIREIEKDKREPEDQNTKEMLQVNDIRFLLHSKEIFQDLQDQTNFYDQLIQLSSFPQEQLNKRNRKTQKFGEKKQKLEANLPQTNEIVIPKISEQQQQNPKDHFIPSPETGLENFSQSGMSQSQEINQQLNTKSPSQEKQDMGHVDYNEEQSYKKQTDFQAQTTVQHDDLYFVIQNTEYGSDLAGEIKVSNLNDSNAIIDQLLLSPPPFYKLRITKNDF